MTVKAGKFVMNVITVIFLFIIIGMWILLRFGTEPYSILTGSMEPTLEVGEIVLVDKNDRDVEVGDVIAFYMGENVVIHRVVELVEDEKYVTKGDANPTEDFKPVEKDEVIGTVWMELGCFTALWNVLASNKKYVLVVVMIFLNIIVDLVFEKRGGANDESS